jgi:hypothetical protein
LGPAVNKLCRLRKTVKFSVFKKVLKMLKI